MKEIRLKTELTSFPPVFEAGADEFIQTEQDNVIVIEVYKNGFPYAVSGTLSAYFIKPDGTTVTIHQNGSPSGNRIEFAMASVCYQQKGRIQMSVILTEGTEKTTLGVVSGYMYPSRL